MYIEWLGIPTPINIYPESIENACNDHIDECDDYHPLSELVSKTVSLPFWKKKAITIY